jgi:hypothetical protein
MIPRNHFIKGPIPLEGLGKWVKKSGLAGGTLFVALHYRQGLKKVGSFPVTLPLEVRKHFGLTRKIITRLRRELVGAGLLSVARDPGRPYKYGVVGQTNLNRLKESF